MANTLYPKGCEAILSGAVNLASGKIRALLLRPTYQFSTDHERLSDVHTATRIAVSDEIAAKTFTDGTFDGGDVTFPTPPAGHTAASVVIFDQLTGHLVAYLDAGVGLPLTTNGASIACKWDDGANRIITWQPSPVG